MLDLILLKTPYHPIAAPDACTGADDRLLQVPASCNLYWWSL